MGIVAAYAVPHPPLIVPSVDRGEERAIQSTVDAYEEVARRIAAHRPDTLIVSSPHAPFFRDCFFVATGERSYGDMRRFTVRDGGIEVANDVEFADALLAVARDRGIPAVSDAAYSAEFDHATYVPLHFINGQGVSCELVRVGLSLLPAEDHRAFGQAIAYCAEELQRRCVFIASGDLSHKLKPDGPYGFVPEGLVFDRAIVDIFSSGDLDGLFSLDEDLCEAAAECGLRSFRIMAGALEGMRYSSELLSYEGPFGVGYGVAAFEKEA